jgi:hypothetical protein
MAGQWDLFDMTAVREIRAFEAGQASATSGFVSETLELLRMVQALLLNGSAECIRLVPNSDAKTPLLFLIHTIADDLRQAELSLEPELHTSIGQQIERGDLPRDDDRVSEIVVEEEQPETERGCRLRGDSQRAERGERVGKMVRHEQGGVSRAPRFASPCQSTPAGSPVAAA